jgi:molybdopterin-dependent oxidoreductase alpha subunit
MSREQDEKDRGPRIVPYDKPAGGLGAIVSTMRHIGSQSGYLAGAKALLAVNQPRGFDCPGCAWPDPDHSAMMEFCENGAKAVADETTRRRLDPAFFAAHSVDDLLERSEYWLNQQGRLTHPMVRRRGATHYEPIGWDEAFALIGDQLKALDHPDEAVFYTSGRTSNEAAFLYQLFARCLGTNNLPDCSNMCHESSGTGMNETLGVGKGTVSLEDFAHADGIFIFGQNPGTNHPRMLTTLQEAARRGARIVSVNPLREAGLVSFRHPKEPWRKDDLSTHYLQVRINGDIALLKGLMKEILEEEARRPGEVLDHGFIEAHTTGFEAFRQALDEVSWEQIVEESGLDREQIREAAHVAIESQNVIACWAMGLTQHKNGVANVQEVINFLLLRGFMGRQGSGACPVRGHSNVQGDRTMGIWEKPPKEFLERLGAEFGFAPPQHHGFDTIEAIEAMEEGRASVFIAMGGNFASAAPDTARTEKALQRCRLTAHVSTKLNRSHLITGEEALILPCLGRSEVDRKPGGPQFVTVENSMSVVHTSRGHRMPASEHLMSEPAIVAAMAEATFGPDHLVGWSRLAEDYGRIRDHIERVIPGFEDFNARLAREGSFVLPNGARERDFSAIGGRARFTINPIEPIALEPDQWLMMTIRSHDQYNTTIYGLDDRYRGIYGHRRVVLLNEADMAEAGLAPGTQVDLVSLYDGVRRVASGFFCVPFDLPRRAAATYFPEANPVVPVEHHAAKSRTPASKSVVIRIERVS